MHIALMAKTRGVVVQCDRVMWKGGPSINLQTGSAYGYGGEAPRYQMRFQLRLGLPTKPGRRSGFGIAGVSIRLVHL